MRRICNEGDSMMPILQVRDRDECLVDGCPVESVSVNIDNVLHAFGDISKKLDSVTWPDTFRYSSISE